MGTGLEVVDCLGSVTINGCVISDNGGSGGCFTGKSKENCPVLVKKSFVVGNSFYGLSTRRVSCKMIDSEIRGNRVQDLDLNENSVDESCILPDQKRTSKSCCAPGPGCLIF